MTAFLSAPTMTTARLTLRAPRPSDFDDSYAMWSDPAVVRFIGGRPASREDVWGRLLRYVGHWAALGYGFWTIQDGDDRFVGECGLADFHRELDPGFGTTPEVGWALAPWAHGQGYGREALQAALAWADVNLSGDRTGCMIDPGNAPSIALAAHCGFAESERTSYKGSDTILFERLRPR